MIIFSSRTSLSKLADIILISKIMRLTKTTYIYLIICTILTTHTELVFSQITKTDYFMESSFLRSNLNPALQPNQGYLVVPVIPNIGINFQTNNLNLSNLTFNSSEGKRVTFMHHSINTNDFLSDLSKDNYLNIDGNVKLFGLGFFKGDNYWNIDLGIRTHIDANIPKSFFELFKRGFDQEAQTRYDLSDLTSTGYSFIELGVANSRSLMENSLTVGARVKVLGGLADYNLYAKSLNIDAGPEYWSAKSEVILRGSAPSVIPTYDEKDNLDGFDFGRFNISGYGLGFDFGAVFDLKKIFPEMNGLKVSFALNDIGFISWSKNNSINMKSPKTEVKIIPSDYTVYKEDGTSLSTVLGDAFDDIKEAVNLREDDRAARTSMLRMNMNIGAEYEIIKEKLSLGALYSNRFGNYFSTSEFTFSLNTHFSSWLYTSLSYSFVHSQLDTFGFALHLAPSIGVNLFLASDYAVPHISSELIPTTSKAINLQFGMSIPLGSKKK